MLCFSQLDRGGLTVPPPVARLIGVYYYHFMLHVLYVCDMQLDARMLTVLKAINSSVPDEVYTKAISQILKFEEAIYNVCVQSIPFYTAIY